MIRHAMLVVALCLVASLSHAPESPFCAGALMAQAQGQDPMMPPEGNPGHGEPPKGAYCDRSARVEHSCKCHNRCEPNDDGTVTQVEDGIHCRAYCFKKACRCPWDNCNAPSHRP
jgi:hypothetical protein